MRKDFYLFRHGQTSYNVENRVQGRIKGSMLTGKGREQAVEVGKKLKDKGIEVIHSSPLPRAVASAEIVAEALGVKVVVDEGLTETSFGIIEGMIEKDARAEYGDVFAKWSGEYPECMDVCFEGGETKRQTYERILSVLENITQKKERIIGIAAHSGVIRYLVRGLFEVRIDAADIKNGAIFHIVYENGEWRQEN
ncbi:MAG: histidine phosphatase family protein [Lactobacillus sp.]|nr:histidine phosphatase family protein [Lactobacillus sp.]